MFGTANHDVKVWDVIGQSASVEIKTGQLFQSFIVLDMSHLQVTVVVASTNRQEMW